MPQLRDLAAAAASRLPFHHTDLPLLWWHNFHSNSAASYSQRRRRNTFGVSSRVGAPLWLVGRAGGHLVAAAPLTRIEVRLSGEARPLSLLTFCGDSVLVPYADLLLRPDCGAAGAAALVSAIAEHLRRGVDLAFLGCIPASSPHHNLLTTVLAEEKYCGTEWLRRTTARAGGVRPWTLEALRRHLAALAGADAGASLKRAVDLFAAVAPAALLFPATRAQFESALNEAVEDNRARPDAQQCILQLEQSLRPAPIRYPYIRLPERVEGYHATLSHETRRYYRRYRKRFFEAGGAFEKVSGRQIATRDIDDYLRLHTLRFGRASAAISEATEHFHRELCRAAGASGNFSLFFATLLGTRIAVHSCFDIDDRREGYLTGRDESFGEFRAGRLLYLETIEDAIRNNYRIYDMGFGGEGYKESFTDDFDTTVGYFMARQGAMPDPIKVVTGYEYFGGE